MMPNGFMPMAMPMGMPFNPTQGPSAIQEPKPVRPLKPVLPPPLPPLDTGDIVVDPTFDNMEFTIESYVKTNLNMKLDTGSWLLI